MSSFVRRMERRILEKVNDSDVERLPFRICKRVKGLTHRQAQRGVRKPPSAS